MNMVYGMISRALFFLILPLISTSFRVHHKSGLKKVFKNELSKVQCDIHEFHNTYQNEVEKSPFRNRTISQITQSWQSTFPKGDYRTNTKNSIPYSELSLRDPDTILRMAEYQAMVYCKSANINTPSDLTQIKNMANKNLRVGNFNIEATGFDEKNHLFWYIASNVAQQSIILVHRGTSSSNTDDVFDDFDRIKIHNLKGSLNRDFPFLTQSKDVYVDTGFYQRYQNEKSSIESAVRSVLNRYSNNSYSFIVVGHSLGAAWAFLNAAHFTTLNDINQRMTAVYTFGQPLLGSALFVNQITTNLNTPKERYVRVVNRNDLIPHIGCRKCIQPQYANEKWVAYTNSDPIVWKDCQGGGDLSCSSGIPCNQLSWTNHSAVGHFSMRGEFCRIASNT